jgi:hypothetical protein
MILNSFLKYISSQSKPNISSCYLKIQTHEFVKSLIENIAINIITIKTKKSTDLEYV